MTNEDNTTDVPISNWTLATGTKPGARYVYSPPTRSTARHVEPKPSRRSSRAARAGDVKDWLGDGCERVVARRVS